METGSWPKRMENLLRKHQDGQHPDVQDLWRFLREFDTHNAAAKDDDAFAKNVVGVCESFQKVCHPASQAADDLGTAFLWLFYVKLTQYLSRVKSPNDSLKVKTTMKAIWLYLGRSSPQNLRVLMATESRLLTPGNLTLESFLFSPLKDTWSKRTFYTRVREFLRFLSGEDSSQTVLETFLTVCKVCDIVGKKCGCTRLRWTWTSCLEMVTRAVQEDVMGLLSQAIQSKYEVLSLSVIELPQDAHALARRMAGSWSPEEAISWADRFASTSASSGSFCAAYLQGKTESMANLKTAINFVKRIRGEPEHPLTNVPTLQSLLRNIGCTHCSRSLVELLMKVAVPCGWHACPEGHVLLPLAKDFWLDQDSLLQLAAGGASDWLEWAFERFCEKQWAEALGTDKRAEISEQLQVSAQTTQRLARVVSSLQSETLLPQLCRALLRTAEQQVFARALEPLPSVLAFLQEARNFTWSVEGHVGDILRALLRRSRSSQGWQNLLGSQAGEDDAPAQPWILALVGCLATDYYDTVKVEMHAPALPKAWLRQPLPGSKIHIAFVGGVLLRALAPSMESLSSSVEGGCYDITATAPMLSPQHLQVIGLVSSAHLLQDTEKKWQHFKQAVSLVVRLEWRNLPRSRLEDLLHSQSAWQGIVAVEALGLKSRRIDDWSLQTFDKDLEELRKHANIAGWLVTRGVAGAEHHAHHLEKESVATLSACRLAEMLDSLKLFLSPIKAHLDLVVHCQKRSSKVFRALLDADSAGQVDLQRIHRTLCECDRQLQELLSQQMPVNRAKALFQGRMSIKQELEKLFEFPKYAHFAAGGAQHRIQTALDTLLYSTRTGLVLNFVKQFELVKNPEQDPSLKELQQSQRNYDVMLADAPAKELKELFSTDAHSLGEAHFRLFEQLQQCPEVVAFFLDNGFLTQQGSRRFEQALHHLTVDLQAQNFETKLLNDVIEVHKLMGPFVTKHESFSKLIKSVLSLSEERLCGNDHLARLQLMRSNIAQVKLWFQSALQGKMESAAVRAELVNQTGCLQVSLGRLRRRPTTLHLSFKLDGNPIRIDEKELRELIQQLTFLAGRQIVSGSGTAKNTSATCKRCVDKLQAAMKAFDALCKLEAHGHPQFQGLSPEAEQISLELSDRQASLQTVLSKVREYEAQLQEWQRHLGEEKRRQPLLAIFEARELLLMHVLLNAVRDTQRVNLDVVQVVTSHAKQTTTVGLDEPEQLRRRAKQALSGFLRSARGFASESAADAEPDHGDLHITCNDNDPISSLQRLARFVKDNLNRTQGSQHRVGVRSGDDRLQQVANLQSDGGEFSQVLSLLEHVFRGSRQWSSRSILWCDAAALPEVVEAFLLRAEAFPTHSFVLIGVNRLAPQLQQMVCDFQKRQSRTRRQGRLVYAYMDMDAAPAADFLAPYPDLPVCTLLELQERFRPLRHPCAGSVTVVCGLPGCGKSTWAHTWATSGSESLSTIAFLDELESVEDSRRIQAELEALSQAGAVRIDISDRANWVAVNRVLFGLFVFGTWHNSEDGTVFATSGFGSLQYLVEVPFRGAGQVTSVMDSLHKHFPSLVVCADATVQELTENMPFTVDEKTRFVSKYWRAFCEKDASGRRLDRLCKGAEVKHKPLKNDKHVLETFQNLLAIPQLQGLSKRSQQGLQRLLYRRFQFFENSHLYRFNSGLVVGRGGGLRELDNLGSRMMQQMLHEVAMLCQPDFICSVKDAPHTVLVYDDQFALKPCWVDGDRNRAELMTLVEEGHNELLTRAAHQQCCALLGWMLQLRENEVESICMAAPQHLHTKHYTSSHAKGTGSASRQSTKEMGFILVSDFFFKIYCIHERREAGIPVIIEGETGVGKTFLLEFYARLLNCRLSSDQVCDATRVSRHFSTWFIERVIPRLANQELAASWTKRLRQGDCEVDFLVELWQQAVEEPLRQPPAAAGAVARGVPAEPQAGTQGETPLHVELQERIVTWLKELPLLDPSEELGEMLKKATLPDTSSELLRAFLRTPTQDLFHRLLLHPDINSARIETFLQEVARKARAAPTATHVVLLDELNTSSVLGFLKAVVVDHRLNGLPLPDNIWIVGCINPYRQTEGTPESVQEYMVHPLPASMLELRWFFPPLCNTKLLDFVTEKVRKTNLGIGASEYSVMLFAKCICECQHVLSTKLGKSSVSQRDVQRCLKVFSFFARLDLSTGDPHEAPRKKFERCMVLSLAIVYYFRIVDDQRYGDMTGAELRRHLDQKLSEEVPGAPSLGKEVDRAVNILISEENFCIPEGVALNRDLRENLFACLVCVETRVPVCLLGPPGRSKTLAFEVLTQNLLGSRSATAFCQKFCAVDAIVYQCSRGSTGQEISRVLERATDRETAYARDGGRTRCVVFLDEGGLPRRDRMALKVLHDPLEEGKLCVIVASNNPLDAANQGRMLTVARQAQTQEDYELMGLGLLAPTQARVNTPGQAPGAVQALVRGLAQAFLQRRQQFTDRDFVALLRHLRADAADAQHNCPTALSLLRGLENNFLKPDVEIEDIAGVFFAEVSKEFDQIGLDFQLPTQAFRPRLQILKDCIQGGLRTRHPHLAQRFCMILDEGEDDAMLRILRHERLLPKGLEVLHVPSTFGCEDDQDLLAVQQMAHLEHCMESGQPVLLRNASRILTPFYNLFNQNYRVDHTNTGEQLLYVIVAHGARTHLARVHADFYVVLHMPLGDYAKQPVALKSRFAQVQVIVNEVQELRLQTLLLRRQPQQIVLHAFARCRSFLEHLGWLQLQRTVESLCLLHLDRFVQALSQEGQPTSRISPLCDVTWAGVELARGLDGAVQTVLLHLLQVVRPECLLPSLASLGHEELYRRVYFNGQFHFSLPLLVKAALDNGVDGERKLLVQTRTSSEVWRLLKLQGGSSASGRAQADFWGEAGLGASAITVLDLDEAGSPALLEDRLARHDQQRLVLVGVDMQGRSSSSVTWLRDVIDRVADARPATVFVLLLHYPPEVILSDLDTCPCVFLDHWEFFFLDSLGFRTPFREDLLLQALCSGSGTADLPSLVRSEDCLHAVTMEFARRSVLPLPREGADEEVHPVLRFYRASATTEERAAALRAVVDHQPEIWHQLVAAFHSNCQCQPHAWLLQLAVETRQGRRLMSLMDSALQCLQQRFHGMALSFLAQLVANEGLMSLMEDTTGSTAALLRLMPVPVNSTTAARIPIQSQRSMAGLSPLFRLLHCQLEQHLVQLTRAEAMQANIKDLQVRIESDSSLKEFCVNSPRGALKGYIRFLVQLTCGRGLSTPLEGLLSTWLEVGTTSEVLPVAATLARLVHVAGIQGGRLAGFAALCRCLESTPQGLGVVAHLALPERGEVRAENGEEWRQKAEGKACSALVEAVWQHLKYCSEMVEQADGEARCPIRDWIERALRTEHVVQLAGQWLPKDVTSSLSGQRQLMQMLAGLLIGIKDKAICRSLCARVATGDRTEGPAWLLSTVHTLFSQHGAALTKRAMAVLLLGLRKDRSLWSQETWVSEVLTCLDVTVQDTSYLLSDDLALLLLDDLRGQGLRQDGNGDWPEVRGFLETRGMITYLPRHAPQRFRDGVAMPRVADLLFTLHARELTDSDERSIHKLWKAAKELAASGVGAYRSVLSCAQGHCFAIGLARWLCRDPAAVNQDCRDPGTCQMLEEAARTILPFHMIPLMLEVLQRRDRAFLLSLLQNEALSRLVPPELFLQSGLPLPQQQADRRAAVDWSARLPLSLTPVHSFSPLGDLREQYSRVTAGLAAALNQASLDPLLAALAEVAAEPLTSGHAKGLLLLAIYHEHYSQEKDLAQLLPLKNWLPRLLPGMPQEELRFFRCFIDPASHQIGYPRHGVASAANDANKMFARDCRDRQQVALRDCLVNILALNLFLPAEERDHFWMHVSKPGALHGHLAFGSSLTSPVGVGVAHYDCGCVFDLDGTFRHGQRCPHWPLQAATASFVHCYGGFILNYLVDAQMHNRLYGHVLTPASIRGADRRDRHYLDMAGEAPADATVQFCYQRVMTSLIYLQDSLRLDAEEVCMLLSLVCEMGIAKLLDHASAMLFQYNTPDQKQAAEEEFRDAFADAVSKRSEVFEALRQNGAESLEKLCPLRLHASYIDFETALASVPPTRSVELLQTYTNRHKDLKMVSLLPPLLGLYWFIHEELNQHLEGSMTENAAAEERLFAVLDKHAQSIARTQKQRFRIKKLRTEGINAFNELCRRLGGMLAVECGRDELVIKEIDAETSLLLVLSSTKAPNSENVLWRALEYLLKLRQDFLNEAERVDGQTSLLFGEMPLSHLVHMPEALEAECSMTVPDFQQCAQATHDGGGAFYLEPLLPLVLQSAVVGKSRWLPGEVKRDFQLRDPASGPLGGDCLPPCFSVTPVAEARGEFEDCLGSMRQSEVVELLTLLLEARGYLLVWPETEGKSQFAERLAEAGFYLPPRCQQSFSSPRIRMEHAGFILQQLDERLQSEAGGFAFVHLETRLRMELPPGVKDSLDGHFEHHLSDSSKVDAALAHFRSHEGAFSNQEARPLHEVFEDTQPAVELQGLLAHFPRKVLCRHLYQVLLRLLALRIRLGESEAGGASGSTKWWESAAISAQDASKGEDEDLPIQGEAGEQDALGGSHSRTLQDLPERVRKTLRRALRRRSQLQDSATACLADKEGQAEEQDLFALTAEEVRAQEQQAASLLQTWWRRNREVRTQVQNLRTTASTMATTEVHLLDTWMCTSTDIACAVCDSGWLLRPPTSFWRQRLLAAHRSRRRHVTKQHNPEGPQQQ